MPIPSNLSMLLRQPTPVKFTSGEATTTDQVLSGITNLVGVGAVANNLGLGDSTAIITMDVSINENHTHTGNTTSYAMEGGADVTDHYINRPFMLSITGEITDTPVIWGPAGLLVDAVGGTFGSLTNLIPGSMSRSQQAYQKMVELKKSGQSFDVVTGLDLYKQMVLTSLSVPRSSETKGKLVFTATMVQVKFVEAMYADQDIINAARKRGAKPPETPRTAKGVINKGIQAAKETTSDLGAATRSLFGVPTPVPAN